jgi:hypothetical protein
VPRRFRLLADIEPLRQSPAFRRLWAGTTLSSVGGALTYFALSLQVFRLTHSSFAVGRSACSAPRSGPAAWSAPCCPARCGTWPAPGGRC